MEFVWGLPSETAPGLLSNDLHVFFMAPQRIQSCVLTWLIFLSSPFKPLTHTYFFVYLYSPILKNHPRILISSWCAGQRCCPCPMHLALSCASAALKRSVLAGFRMVHQCQQPRESQPLLFLSQDNVSHSSLLWQGNSFSLYQWGTHIKERSTAC